MRKFILGTVAISALLGATAVTASAAPSAAVIEHRAPASALITKVDYDHHHEWRHHEWHHRRWEHDHWHYWD